MKKDIEGVVVSDIHLGHSRTPTPFIIDNLNKHITNDAVFSSIDLIVFAGDVFDTLLDFADDDSHDIKRWIAHTLKLAFKHGVAVIVLEGTPSHDRKQSSVFVTINDINAQAGFCPAELYYVDTLSVLHLEHLGISALMVPDEWGPTTADTLDQVQALLANEGLERVDFSFMHGMFEYQMDYEGVSTHNAQAYLDLTQHLIFIGHVHTYSSFQRIFAQGSFDRLIHGEEGPKGFLRFKLNRAGDYEVKFIENTTAAIYKTIECAEDTIADNLLLIEKEIKGLPNTARVRILASKASALLANQSIIKEKWPHITWSIEAMDKAVKKVAALIDHKKKYVPIQLNRQNLAQVMRARLVMLNIEPDTIDRCDLRLNEVM